MTDRPTDLTDDELAGKASLPLDHPEVKALQSDPQVWARGLALREFLNPSDVPEGARTSEAVARLESATRSALAGGGSEPIREHPERPSGGGMWRAWLRPWPMTVAAAAAVTIAFLVVPRPQSPTLRGSHDQVVVIEGLRTDGTGTWLSWRSVADADGYEVVLLRDDLTQFMPPFTVTDTTWALDARVIDSLRSGVTVYARVVALRRGVPVAESEARSLTLQ